MSNTTFERINKSDFILVCNFDPIQTHPVLYIKLHKAARRGQTVYMGCCPDSKLAKKSNGLNIPDDKKVLFLQYLVDMINRSDWFEKAAIPSRKSKIEQLFTSVSGTARKTNLKEFNLSKKDFDSFFKKMIHSKNPLFLCHRESANPEIVHWLNSLGYILGQTEAFLALSSSVNLQGMLDMGVHHQYLPGYQKISKSEIINKFSQSWDSELPSTEGLSAQDMHQKIVKGEIKNIIFWNQDPVGAGEMNIPKSKNSFIIVADMFLTETAKLADVVFPLAPFMESDGMVTNAESRIQKFNRVIKPQTGKENWKILNDLGSNFDRGFKFSSTGAVNKEINNIIPEYQKEIAIFRNGYSPDENLLKKVRYSSVKFGANYLLKWLEEQTKSPRKIVLAEEKEEASLIN
jgi:predicted molibdopterin-dependent oxidoreductase YjgC